MKKYIKFIILFILLLIVGIFIFKTYNTSFKSKPQVKYSELEDFLTENTDCLIYVTNKKNTKELDNYFKDNNIEIVYLYLTRKDKKAFENKYGINSFPKLVHFKDSIIEEYITYDRNTIEDFLTRNGFLK